MRVRWEWGAGEVTRATFGQDSDLGAEREWGEFRRKDVGAVQRKVSVCERMGRTNRSVPQGGRWERKQGKGVMCNDEVTRLV